MEREGVFRSGRYYIRGNWRAQSGPVRSLHLFLEPVILAKARIHLEVD
jgi:hypothetical protein